MKERSGVDDIRKKVGSIDLTERFSEMVKFRVPTGILAFDRVLGGGIPGSKLSEIFGDFSSGKSRLACHILAETQRLGGIAVLIDTERSLDTGLAKLTGLDVENLVYPDPDKMLTSIESVFDRIKEVLEYRSSHPDDLMVICWDSVASSPGIEDLEKEIGRNEASMRRAKVIGDGIRQVMATVYSTRTALILINQVREKIGIVYGDKVTTVGGAAIKFAASVRAHCHLAGKIKDEKTGEQIGNKGRFVIEKSKVSRPFGVVNFSMMADSPIDKYTGLLDYMCRHSEATDEGRGWYSIPGIKKNFREDDFPEIYESKLAGKESE